MRFIKTTIVRGLDVLCEYTGHHLCGYLGTWSFRLDDRWGTAVWYEDHTTNTEEESK